MAFLVCSEFSVYGVVQKVIYCVAAPLNKALGYMLILVIKECCSL